MVDFAGWLMPVQYKDLGIQESTIHTRQSASIFDVSHMGQLHFYGKNRIDFLEYLVISQLKPLKCCQVKYSLMCNNNGGVIDDLVLANREDKNLHYVVINAGRVKEDLQHMKEQLKKMKKEKNWDVDMEVITKNSLIAYQGPKAVQVMQRLIPNYNFKDLNFFYLTDLNICGIPCQVSRSGYTGEDGFEIAVPNEKTKELTEILLNEPESRLAGLGARDSLRLEAGLCLYGNDLTETITPIEADLLWTMSKTRRTSGHFIGCEIIRNQIEHGVKRQRIGLIGEKGVIPRSHMKIMNNENKEIGEVSSGGFSPCLQKPIAMGYVEKKYCEKDTTLKVEIRKDKIVSVKVTPLPFVQKGYYKNE